MIAAHSLQPGSTRKKPRRGARIAIGLNRFQVVHARWDNPVVRSLPVGGDRKGKQLNYPYPAGVVVVRLRSYSQTH